MPLPKFSNPHLLRQATQTVSRADIYADDNISGEVYLDGNAQDDVLALEGLLKRSLGDFQFETTASVPQQSPTKTEKRKHKRRKLEKSEDTQVADEDEIFSFRLFSNAPPKSVSLKPKPAPEVKTVERSYEDDDAEASRRAERAKAVAVDFDWILEQSRQPVYPLRNDKVIHATLDAQSGPLPALLVAEIPKPPLNAPSLPLSSLKLPEKERPSPHDFPADKLCCPVISVHEQTNPDTQGKKRRRRRKTREAVARPPPSFFRPLREWGGKSAGYAMGYEGSRSVPVGSTRQWRYRRDGMRSGVMSKW